MPNEDNILQIPFVAHEERMTEAYQREQKLFRALCISNVIWLIAFILLVILS